MISDCNILNGDISGCNPGDLIGGAIGSAAGSAWESVCKSFADAAVALLDMFAKMFAGFPDPDLTSIAQPGGPYAISMWIAGGVAVLVLLGQVIRTAVTHDGSAIAQGLVGAGKLLLAMVATLTIATAAMSAANNISDGIINSSLGGADGLKKKLTTLFAFSSSGATGEGKLAAPASLVLILALIGIVLTLVLWFEMLLRNAAILVLIATAPIAAAGQMSESTRSWWTKLCSATVQLIILKPIITLIFAISFGILDKDADPAKPADIVTILSGMLILLLAAVAWPVIARFFTFAQVSFAGGGMAGLLGFAAGRANAGSGPAGVNPAQFSQATEARTMASSGASSAAGAEGAGLISGGSGAAAAGGGSAAASVGAMAGAGALGAVAAPVAIAAAGIDIAQRAVNSLAGRMEQTAGHAGVHNANPHHKPAGYSQYYGSWSSAAGGSRDAPPPVQTDRSSAAVPAPDPRGHNAAAAADPGPPPPIAEPGHTSAIEYTTPFDNSGPIEEVGR